MIDCSNVVNFFRESDRICGLYDCPECPLCSQNNENHISYCPDSLDHENIEKAVEIVQKWSDEHPYKTMLDVFLEEYPNAPLHRATMLPRVCPHGIGYEGQERMTKDCVHKGWTCDTCWSRPIEGMCTIEKS